MFIVRILILFLIVIITLPLSVDAQTIGLPSLTDVMKKNEKDAYFRIAINTLIRLNYFLLKDFFMIFLAQNSA